MSKLDPDEALAPSPCPEGFVPINDGSMSSEMFLQWLAIREIECGPRLFFDAQTGAQLTDQEILVRVFNGSTPLSEVPLPAGLLLLLTTLVILWRFRRG